jgi:RNA polymerase sigma-70 factor (ECF subfamily)
MIRRMISEEPLEPLLAAVARGQQPAFAELYARTSPHLFALLLRMLGRRDWAEEALQDCYVRIWQRSESYDAERGAPMAWLMTIARYRALDLLRARRPELTESQFDADAPSPLERADETASPEADAVAGEGLGRLEKCMEGLGLEQRQSVLLAYYEGYTHTELARRLQAPVGTVKSWVRRGLLQLRECLGAAA